MKSSGRGMYSGTGTKQSGKFDPRQGFPGGIGKHLSTKGKGHAKGSYKKP